MSERETVYLDELREKADRASKEPWAVRTQPGPAADYLAAADPDTVRRLVDALEDVVLLVRQSILLREHLQKILRKHGLALRREERSAG